MDDVAPQSHGDRERLVNSELRELALVQLRQHVASDEIAFGEVRVPGENERGDSGVANLADLRHDLVGVTDNCNTGPTARPTDASP